MADETTTPTLEERVAKLESQAETLAAKITADITTAIEKEFPNLGKALEERFGTVETILASVSNEMKHVLQGRANPPPANPPPPAQVQTN